MASKAVNKKIRKRKRRFMFLVFLVLVATCVYFIFRTSIFNINEVIVKGNEQIETEKVILASGIEKGINIFKLNKSAVIENIKMHPYVKEVRVFRKLPDKIVIDIVERKEAFIVKTMNTFVYVDEEGIILNVLSEKNNLDISELNGFSINNVIIGNNLKLEDEISTSDILNFIDRCSKASILNQISIIKKDKEDELVITLKNGINIEFGNLKEIEHKLAFIKSILEDLKLKGINKGKISFNKGKNPVFVPVGN